jgi:hypothetical protein
MRERGLNYIKLQPLGTLTLDLSPFLGVTRQKNYYKPIERERKVLARVCVSNGCLLFRLWSSYGNNCFAVIY